MLLPDVWLYICMYLSIFLCLAVTFRLRFHSDHLTTSLTALSKRSTMHTLVSTHKHTEQRSKQTDKKHPSLSHNVSVRLTILFCSFLLLYYKRYYELKIIQTGKFKCTGLEIVLLQTEESRSMLNTVGWRRGCVSWRVSP